MSWFLLGVRNYCSNLCQQGHLCYGLKTMSIRIANQAAQTYQIDFYLILTVFKIFFSKLSWHFIRILIISLKGQKREATYNIIVKQYQIHCLFCNCTGDYCLKIFLLLGDVVDNGTDNSPPPVVE